MIHQCWKSSHILRNASIDVYTDVCTAGLETCFLDFFPTQHTHLWNAAINSTERRNQHFCHLCCAFGSVNKSWRLIMSPRLFSTLSAVKTSWRLPNKCRNGLTMPSIFDTLSKWVRFVRKYRDTPKQRLGVVEVGGKHEKPKSNEGMRTSKTPSIFTPAGVKSTPVVLLFDSLESLSDPTQVKNTKAKQLPQSTSQTLSINTTSAHRPSVCVNQDQT